MSALSPVVQTALATLLRGSEAIDAVTGVSDPLTNRFADALVDLQRLSETLCSPMAIVGGLGAIRYGYPAATQDIDVAVDRADLDRLLLAANTFGFTVAWESKLGWHTTVPGPTSMGLAIGLDYAPLPAWMELKVSFHRSKDQAHVVEVLKKNAPATIDQLASDLLSIHPIYGQRFADLRAQAITEAAQEGKRR